MHSTVKQCKPTEMRYISILVPSFSYIEHTQKLCALLSAFSWIRSFSVFVSLFLLYVLLYATFCSMEKKITPKKKFYVVPYTFLNAFRNVTFLISPAPISIEWHFFVWWYFSIGFFVCLFATTGILSRPEYILKSRLNRIKCS